MYKSSRPLSPMSYAIQQAALWPILNAQNQTPALITNSVKNELTMPAFSQQKTFEPFTISFSQFCTKPGTALKFEQKKLVIYVPRVTKTRSLAAALRATSSFEEIAFETGFHAEPRTHRLQGMTKLV